MDIREEILHAIAKNARIQTEDLAIMLGREEEDVREQIRHIEE